MARPVKEGLDYFPFDVDFATNEKTEAITGEFGPKGVLIFIYLLAAIYRKGYYLEWTELAKNQLVNRVSGATGELVGLVVKRLTEYGTFNKDLFLSDNVLTSQRIQETFTDATKRRKSQKPTLYWINADNNSSSNGVNDYINTQSKVKESKQKKRIPPKSPKGDGSVLSLPEEFATEVWPAYPKKQGNYAKSQEAYVQAVESGETTKDQVLAKIAEYKAYIKLNNKQEGFVTTAGNWFTGHGWRNEYDTKTPEKQPDRKEVKENWGYGVD